MDDVSALRMWFHSLALTTVLSPMLDDDRDEFGCAVRFHNPLGGEDFYHRSTYTREEGRMGEAELRQLILDRAVDTLVKNFLFFSDMAVYFKGVVK